jgi:hypothetical protein
MIKEHAKEVFVCERLERLGYAPQQRVKLYGEEFDLVSNPMRHGVGYVIEGVSCKSGGSRRIRIPLPLVRMIEHELLAIDNESLAA